IVQPEENAAEAVMAGKVFEDPFTPQTGLCILADRSWCIGLARPTALNNAKRVDASVFIAHVSSGLPVEPNFLSARLSTFVQSGNRNTALRSSRSQAIASRSGSSIRLRETAITRPAVPAASAALRHSRASEGAPSCHSRPGSECRPNVPAE